MPKALRNIKIKRQNVKIIILKCVLNIKIVKILRLKYSDDLQNAVLINFKNPNPSMINGFLGNESLTDPYIKYVIDVTIFSLEGNLREHVLAHTQHDAIQYKMG